MNLQSFEHGPGPPNFGICYGPGQNYTGPPPQRATEKGGARTCVASSSPWMNIKIHKTSWNTLSLYEFMSHDFHNLHSRFALSPIYCMQSWRLQRSHVKLKHLRPESQIRHFIDSADVRETWSDDVRCFMWRCQVKLCQYEAEGIYSMAMGASKVW